MRFLGSLFGTEKAVENILDKENGLLTQVGSWVGGFNYTDQEKAEANKETREWGLKQLDALQPFKVVQRIIAFCVIGLWAIGGLSYMASIWIEVAYNVTGLSAKMLTFIMSDYLFYPAVTVLSLYFSGGVVDSFFRGKKGK